MNARSQGTSHLLPMLRPPRVRYLHDVVLKAQLEDLRVLGSAGQGDASHQATINPLPLQIGVISLQLACGDFTSRSYCATSHPLVIRPQEPCSCCSCMRGSGMKLAVSIRPPLTRAACHRSCAKCHSPDTRKLPIAPSRMYGFQSPFLDDL